MTDPETYRIAITRVDGTVEVFNHLLDYEVAILGVELDWSTITHVDMSREEDHATERSQPSTH